MRNKSPYANLTPQVHNIILESFERIGIPGEFITGQEFDAALRSINFMFQEWMATGINLWSLTTGFVGINEGQGRYRLSNYLNCLNTIIPNNQNINAQISNNNIVKDIDAVFLRTSQRNLGGIAQPNNQTVAYHGTDQLFTDIPGSYCEFNAGVTEEQISYFYAANPPLIQMIGISGFGNINNTYQISVVGGNGPTILNIPSQTFGNDQFGNPIVYWFAVPAPKAYDQYDFNIVCDATQTLVLTNIFLQTNVIDTQISAISRSNYLSIPNKNQQSRPSSYYFDRQVDPVLSIWPVPTSQYNCLMISYQQMIQDISGALDLMAMAAPTYYNEAIIWGLSYRMACKYAPDKISFTKQMADQSFMSVSDNNSETTPLSITPDWSQR